MTLSSFNIITCLVITAMCVWAELSRHTTKSFWLSCARAALALTALIEGSQSSHDPAIVVAQVLMNGAVALLLVVTFLYVQTNAARARAVRERQTLHPVFRDYAKQFAFFWRW